MAQSLSNHGFQYSDGSFLQEYMPRTESEPLSAAAGSRDESWDLFISHASEDKEEFVCPLAEALQRRGLRVWYDEFTLTVGDSLRRSIDRGLSHSRFGVVILSPAFFEKSWPQYELDGLVTREVDGQKVILPIWHNVTREQVQRYSPSLAGRFAALSTEGIEAVVSKLLEAMRLPNSSREKPAVPGGTSHSETASQIALKVLKVEFSTEFNAVIVVGELLNPSPNQRLGARPAQPDGTLARLKIRDHPAVGGYLVFLKRRKS